MNLHNSLSSASVTNVAIWAAFHASHLVTIGAFNAGASSRLLSSLAKTGFYLAASCRYGQVGAAGAIVALTGWELYHRLRTSAVLMDNVPL